MKFADITVFVNSGDIDNFAILHFEYIFFSFWIILKEWKHVPFY